MPRPGALRREPGILESWPLSPHLACSALSFLSVASYPHLKGRGSVLLILASVSTAVGHVVDTQDSSWFSGINGFEKHVLPLIPLLAWTHPSLHMVVQLFHSSGGLDTIPGVLISKMIRAYRAVILVDDRGDTVIDAMSGSGLVRQFSGYTEGSFSTGERSSRYQAMQTVTRFLFLEATASGPSLHTERRNKCLG